MAKTEKKLVITSKDIKASELVNSTWIDVFITFIGTEIAGRCFEDLRTINSCLNELWIYPDTITSITLSITDDGEDVKAKVKNLLY